MLVSAIHPICDQRWVLPGNFISSDLLMAAPWTIILISDFRVTVILLPILTFVIYLPSLFRHEVVKCVLYADGSITYYKRDNLEFLQTMFYSVSF